MLYMFRTVLVHHQEQLYKLCIVFGICRYHTCGCCVAISRLHTLGLLFGIIFGILLLLILVACRNQFDLYLFSFLSTGSTFKIFQNFFIPFVVKKGVPPAVLLKKFTSIDVSRFLSFFLRVQISLQYKRNGES